ncbi:MAG: hypothetical protein H0W86_10270 [Armatimonadetes bacterium]|nr:hypothetical protein [Armatimonadota bacterium]
MTSKETIKNIERSIEMLRQAADGLAGGLPALRKEFEAGVETKATLDKTSRLLLETESQLANVSRSLGGIEGAVLDSMSAAREGLHDPTVSLESRMEVLRLCQKLFSKLAPAGFEVDIPEIGVPVSLDRHAVKGRARSKLGSTEIADVISWGYRFPSGQSQLAEVLVGDASLRDEAEEAAKPSPPSKKAGIAMVIDEDTDPRAKKAAKKVPATMFDHLAEAAERNKEG